MATGSLKTLKKCEELLNKGDNFAARLLLKDYTASSDKAETDLFRDLSDRLKLDSHVLIFSIMIVSIFSIAIFFTYQ